MLDVHCSFQYLNHADNFLVRRGLGNIQDSIALIYFDWFRLVWIALAWFWLVRSLFVLISLCTQSFYPLWSVWSNDCDNVTLLISMTFSGFCTFFLFCLLYFDEENNSNFKKSIKSCHFLNIIFIWMFSRPKSSRNRSLDHEPYRYTGLDPWITAYEKKSKHYHGINV